MVQSHDDTYHNGSAKRGQANGLCDLDASTQIVNARLKLNSVSGPAGLDGSSKLANTYLYMGSGNGLDADKWDGKDRPASVYGCLSDDGAGNLSLVKHNTVSAVTVGTTYQASADGFCIASFPGTGSAGTIYHIVTDASATPSTEIVRSAVQAGNQGNAGIMCPVKKGDYYKVVSDSGSSPTAYFVAIA